MKRSNKQDEVSREGKNVLIQLVRMEVEIMEIMLEISINQYFIYLDTSCHVRNFCVILESDLQKILGSVDTRYF